MNDRFLKILSISSILILSLVLRFVHLYTIPPGFFVDEAVSGLCGLDILEGRERPIYFDRLWGVDSLYPYLTSISFFLFGPSIFSIRSVAAFSGVLTILLLFLFVRLLFDFETALISSFILAISRWHITFSRIGFQGVNLSPLFNLLTFYLFFRALKYGKFRDFILSGISFGIGFYSHFSFRVVPLILLSFILLKSTNKGFFKERWQGLIIMISATTLFVAPLAYYFLLHPGILFERQRMVSISGIGDAFDNLIKVLLMFGFKGDMNPRHNIPGYPMLPFPIFLLSAGGFILTMFHSIRARRERDLFLLIWFGFSILPSILSTEAPHASRNLASILPVSTFAGIFAIAITSYVKKGKGLLILLIFLLISISGFRDVYGYFNVWAMDERTRRAHESGYLDLSLEVIDSCQDKVCAIPLSLCLYPSFNFFLRTQKIDFFVLNDHSSFIFEDPPPKDILFLLPLSPEEDKNAYHLVQSIYPGGTERGHLKFYEKDFLSLYEVGRKEARSGLSKRESEIIDLIFLERREEYKKIPWLKEELSYCEEKSRYRDR